MWVWPNTPPNAPPFVHIPPHGLMLGTSGLQKGFAGRLAGVSWDQLSTNPSPIMSLLCLVVAEHVHVHVLLCMPVMWICKGTVCVCVCLSREQKSKACVRAVWTPDLWMLVVDLTPLWWVTKGRQGVGVCARAPKQGLGFRGVT